MATTATPSSIRFPPSLRERVVALAERERRSFSSQCLRLIETALDEPDALPAGEQTVLDDLRRDLDAREVSALGPNDPFPSPVPSLPPPPARA